MKLNVRPVSYANSHLSKNALAFFARRKRSDRESAYKLCTAQEESEWEIVAIAILKIIERTNKLPNELSHKDVTSAYPNAKIDVE